MYVRLEVDENTPSGTDWVQLVPSGFTHVAVGPSVLWAIDEGEQIWHFFFGPVNVPDLPVAPIVEPPEPTFPEDIVDPFTETDGLLTQLDVGYHNSRVFGVASDNTIWYRQGITTDVIEGTNWVQLAGGRATHITVCDDTGHTWVVGMDDGAWFTPQTYYNDQPMDAWTKETGGDVLQMDCGANGNTWLVTNANSIWIRTGITDGLPQGTDW